MTGTVYKNKDNQWMVKHTFSPLGDYVVYTREYQLHPDDVNEILEDSKVFDNIEARIAAYPTVEFQIVENKKMSGIVEYAKLIKS